MLTVWADADEDPRAQISRLVQRLRDAEVAFAAATGDLVRYRSDREYRLWKVVSEGGPRSAERWARIRAAPSLGAAVRLAFRATLVNVDHLEHRIGRTPTRIDILLEFFRRPATGIGEVARSLHRWVRVRRGGDA